MWDAWPCAAGTKSLCEEVRELAEMAEQKWLKMYGIQGLLSLLPFFEPSTE